MGYNYETIGRLFPRQHAKPLKGTLDSAGIDLTPESFLGFSMSFIFFLGLLLTIIFFTASFTFDYLVAITQLFGQTSGSTSFAVMLVIVDVLISYLISIICVVGGSYIVFIMRTDNRRKSVEAVLPDFLLLSAANVRAGMTVDQALWYAAKPEFGLLTVEIELLARKTFGGEPFDKAINVLAKRFNSKSMLRAVSLIKQGMASGGELADILESTGEESRNMQIIKKDISSSLLMYVIFIVFASTLATPFLFAISHQLLMKLEEIFAKLPAQDSAQAVGGFNSGLAGMLKFSSIPVTSGEFLIFSLIIMTITILISSMIVGIIQKGSKKEGFKYFPLMWVTAIILYFVVGTALSFVLQYLTY